MLNWCREVANTLLSVLIAVAIFVFFGVVGYAAEVLATKRPNGVLILLAPTVGVAVLLLPTMLLNYIGVPVKIVGPLLALILLITSAVVIWRGGRPDIPRWFWIIGLVLLGALILNAWPMFLYGRDWLAYTNGDMQTYVQTAANIFAHGFLAPPDPIAYMQQRTMTIPYEVRSVLLNRRTGTENLIALVMSLTGRDGYQIYMPLIVSAQLALISAGASLVYDVRQSARATLGTAIVLAFSPLLTLGLDYQLLPQVFGIALFIAAMLMLCRPVSVKPAPLVFFRRACLSAVIFAAFIAVYPETLAIFCVAAATYYVDALARRRIAFSSAVIWVIASAIGALVFLNVHISTMLQMLALTLSFGVGPGGIWSAFTAYLIPSGIPALFGLWAVTWPTGAALSAAIIAGSVLLVISIVAMCSLLWRGRLVAFGLFAMLLGVPLLFVHKNGFGLFKLAMYMQPFLIAVLIAWWSELNERVPLRGETA